MKQINIGSKVTPTNTVSKARTLDGEQLPNLQIGLTYTIDYLVFRHDTWWYGVKEIPDTIYTEDEFKLITA